MGTYDTVYLKVKCPYCGETSEMDFQTKDGDYFMNEFRVGDIFQEREGNAGKFKFIDAIGSCESFRCQLEAAKESVWESGYYGGFSRSFDVYIYLDKEGRITDKFRIYQLNAHKGIMHGKLGELPDEDNYKYESQKRKGKSFNKTWMAKKVKIKTDGWLDKFETDKTRYSYDTGKLVYEAIMYVFNLEDGEKAFELWFVFRHKFRRIAEYLKNNLNLKDDAEFASVFLSNDPQQIYELV